MRSQLLFRMLVMLLYAMVAEVAGAHEGHQPLPTEGIQVDTKSGQLTLSVRAQDAIGLKSEEVEVGTVVSSLNVYAESVTTWHGKAFGSAQIPGRIAKLLVRPGDFVDKHQVIAELSSRDLELVKLDYLQATNELALNRRLLAMARPSAKSGAVPMQRLLYIENAVEQGQNRVDVARVRAHTLGVSFDGDNLNEADELRYPIRSPISGQVLHADLAEGNYVDAFEHLFEIVNTDEVWVRLQLLEKDCFKVNVGNRVRIDFPTSSLSVEGVIDQIDAGLDLQRQVSSAWVSLKRSDFVPGLVGNATIYTSEQAETLTVPQRSVYSDGLQNYVFVEEASTRTVAEYRKKAIRLGKRSLATEKPAEPMVEVLQGDIYPGDRVVVRGGHELSSLFFLGVLKLTSSEQDQLGIQTESAAQREIAIATRVPAMVTLPPENRSVISSQLDGTVYSHSLSPGRKVKAGEKLIEIASPEFYKLQLDLISTSLDAALSRRRADRLDDIKGDAVSLRIVLETRAQAEQLESRVLSLRRQLTGLGLLDTEIESIVKHRQVMDYLPVRTNIDGRIVSSAITLGETITASQPLVEVHDLGVVWLEAHLPASEMDSILKGFPGVATILANPEIEFSVDLSRTGPVVNQSTRTQTIWLTPGAAVSQPELRAGTLMTVSLPKGTPIASLAIPSTAIVRDGMRYFTFVQKSDGYVERRHIMVGRSDGEYTEVINGVVAGESVVTVGGRELQTAFASLR